MSQTLRNHRAVVRQQIPALGLNVLDVPEDSADAIIQSLSATGLFQYVERDYYAHTAAAAVITPNDPSFPSQWHLPQIQAPQAWVTTTGASSVVIAVIDSGVDGTHPDLASKLLPGWSFVANTANTSDTMGHGTAVTGTIAAASNNGVGVAGVTWKNLIMPLVVVDATEFASYSNIAAAIQYAADNGARIVNISIGGASSSSTLQSAVDYAWGKGVVIFASAMNNSSSTPYYPAACNHVVSVSATDNNDAIASFSNFGNWISVAAPGTNILTTTEGGGYGYWYGTSFSSPIAAGVAALALSVNPSLSAGALVSMLEQNSDDIGAPGFDTYFGWGRVNAFKTVTAAQQSLISLSIAPGTVMLNSGQTLQFTPTVAGASASAVTWALNPAVGSIAGGLYTAPATISANQTVTVTATVSGVSSSATITLVPATISIAPGSVTLNQGQSQQFTATVTGASASAATWALNPAVGSIAGGLYTAPATISANQTVTVTATVSGVSSSATITLAPAAISIAPGSVTLNQGQTQQFTANVSGASASAVTWALNPAVGSIAGGLYTAPATISANQTVTVTATVAGVSSSATITLVRPSISIAPGSVTLNQGQTQQFTATVSGASASAVTWALNPAVGSIAGGLYTAPATISANQTVTVTATVSGVTSSATITLAPSTISIAPGGVTLNQGQTQQFTATVSGASASAVTWALNPAVGSIAGGLYTAPATISANQTVTVTATVSGVSSSATITLVRPSISIAPASVTLNQGQTQQFTPTVSGASASAATWALNPAVGSIAGGLYTAPATISANQTVTVTATVSGVSSAATITLVRPSISIAPASVTLNQGQTQQFTATVTGASASAATWALSPAVGSIAGGLYTAPATISTNQTVTVTATVSGVSSSAIVNLAAPISIMSAFTPIRVHAGGAAYTDPLGQSWAADNGYIGGYTSFTSSPIANTTASTLYQTCRWGAFNYQFAVPNGTYTVNLKFAEISQTAAGQREFNVAVNGAAVLTNFDIYAAAGGALLAVDKPFPVTVTNGQINIAFTSGAANQPIVSAIEILGAGVTPAPIPAPTPAPISGFTPIRVNAGGGSYIDAANNKWGADNGYSGGYTYTTGSAIAGASAQALYQTCRWGVFTYQYAVPNGSYTVTLKFAELSQFGTGKRQFNVAINGTPVLTNFDIFAKAGALTALDQSFPVTVTGGQLSIVFTAGAADQPLVNAIDIEAAAPVVTGSAFAPIRVRSGGPAYQDPNGNLWSSDNSYSGGYSFGTGNTIANTATPALYQDCRWGDFTYQFAVPNGNYTVILKFAEVSLTAVGGRMFNVAIDNTPVLTNFDVLATAGGAFTAIDQSFPVTVSNGQINIAFTTGAADLPLVNAIEIVSGTGTGSSGAISSSSGLDSKSLRSVRK